MIAVTPSSAINPTRMSIDVTPMTTAHIAAALALWAESEGVEICDGDSHAELEAYFQRNPGMSMAAVDDTGRLVGAVLCGHDGRRGFVYHLAVAKDQRGRGIGRALMQRSLAELRRAGLRRVLLLVSADNDGGHEFWLREGWEDMTFAQPMGLDL
jgi:ribosomal protein S18 acetylase RimI-like enzyme